MTLILASASPRRLALLEAAGLTCTVDVLPIDEQVRPGEAPETYVERLAIEKARLVAARHPEALVLGADTAVVVDDVVLGKPADEADAARMLRILRGRSHEVLTGFSLVGPGGQEAAVERTRVWVADLTDAEIDAYVATGEPVGKAGAYAIQGRASVFIPRIEGSYANVVGLPVAAVAAMLRRRSG